jgi:hypothetical protein
LTGTKTASRPKRLSRALAARQQLDPGGRDRRLAVLEEAAPAVTRDRQRRLDQPLEERPAEHLLGVQAEEQVGGLSPLRDGALAVREDEEAADDLPQKRVERIQRRVVVARGRLRRRTKWDTGAAT